MSVKKISGDIGTYQFESWRKIVNSGAHPPIYKLVKFATGSGVLPAGLIVGLNDNNLGVAYNPNASPNPQATPRYILVEDLTLDATDNVVGLCLIHGIAIGAKCLVGAVGGTHPDDADKLKLEPFIILE